MDSKELDSGFYIMHEYCIASEVSGKKDCSSSDGMAIYSHDGNEDSDGEEWYDSSCFSCGQGFTKEQLYKSSLADKLGVAGGELTERVVFERKPKAEPMTQSEVKDYIKKYGYLSGDYRGIKDEYSRYFGHLTELDKNGKVLSRRYPETRSGSPWPTGYKIRYHPKAWNKTGLTGINNELSGQTKFKEGGKRLLICPGEEDKVAGFGMLRDAQIARGHEEYEPIAVVSPTTGEGSAAKQIANNYDFCASFDEIVVGMDQDPAGREAAAAICKVLPPEKLKIAKWSLKDPNAMLLAGKEKQFVRDFYSAKEYIASGIVGSGSLDALIEEELMIEKVPLPQFMHLLQKQMSGGIPLGYIVNITGETGGGKTTMINELLYHWIFNSAHKLGIVSLELTSAQYGIAMLSRHIGRKLNLFEDGQAAVDYIRTPEIQAKREELWTTEYGEDRWTLLDERDGSLDQCQKQCEILIKKHQCKFIVLDPLQDLLDGTSMEEQSLFMRWQKQQVKGGVTFININHTRKTGNSNKTQKGELRDLIEDDIHGSSAIAKSGGANIFLMRDKYAESEIDKNTTIVKAGKIRWSGRSGASGKWYYHPETHTMWELEDFLESHPDADDRQQQDSDRDTQGF